MSDVAVPLPDDDQVRAVTPGYDPATTLNVVKMMAGTDDMNAAAVALTKAVFAAEGIPPVHREIISLRAATVNHVPYEWAAHVVMGRNEGLTQEQIDAAGREGPVTGIDADMVLLCRATDELCDATALTDDTLQALLDRFGATPTRKYVLIIGWWALLGIFLNGCRVPMETTDKVGGGTSPF